MVDRAQIIVKGIVQGVGFRPYVFNLAASLRLKGYVTNTSEGVLIDVEGDNIPSFVERLRNEAPPLSRITDLTVSSVPYYGYSHFTIKKSVDEAARPFTLVSPDVSICGDCLRELLDPANRRYLYPFINCTNCGPRYSITTSVPYDRPNTTMAHFAMCPDCVHEYEDPRDRRFHAQPNACPACGPEVEFRITPHPSPLPGGEREQHKEHPLPHGERMEACPRMILSGVRGKKAVEECIRLLKNGGIVAIKGIGGFHIACDAANESAVRRLREKKRKSNKPFAVMSATIQSIESYCFCSEEERKLLESNKRPIVLLKKKYPDGLSAGVSPGNQYIGCMLPYTPLHYLLFHYSLQSDSVIRESYFQALVMTSGNLSEEPIVHDNDEALKKLSGIADGFLLHNRDIFMRVDDSVLRVRNAECGMRNGKDSELRTPDKFVRGQASHSAVAFIRRSRGYAPDPIELREEGPEVLGCGADLKNTFTLTKGKFAIPSQHIGDMENYETLRFFEESLENLKAVYRAEPRVIVHDLHPEYISTKWAIECGVRSAECGFKTFAVQHHYAHIGSVMAEHGLRDKVIGVAFDGTGYGTDGNIWGGEFLICDINGFERAGQFRYIPLPGGESAIKEPWRTAVSYIVNSAGDRAWEYFEKTGFNDKYGRDTLEKVSLVARSKELTPLTSGAGRLFDAVSAILGVCDLNTFEGEAAMALEALTKDGIEDDYPFELECEKSYTVINFNGVIISLLRDMVSGLDKAFISTKFHNTVASVMTRTCSQLKKESEIDSVALSGGTFQNQYLLKRTLGLLSKAGMKIFINQKVPCNDGGISLGQAYLIREKLRRG